MNKLTLLSCVLVVAALRKTESNPVPTITPLGNTERLTLETLDSLIGESNMWLQPNIRQPSLNPTHTVRVGCLVIRSHYVFSLSLSLCLFVSTPAPALVTKAMSKVPLSPRAPWDTRRHPSRAPSTPTRPTVTEAPSHSWTSRGVSSSSNQTSLYTIGPSQGVAPPSRSDPPPPVHYIIPSQASSFSTLLLTSVPTAFSGTATRQT